MADMDGPVRKRRKVSLACATCRERKIRCSGEKPVCASCHRRSEECSYAVRLESIPDMTESIQSVLDRLQRLESQNQALVRGQSISNAGSDLQTPVRESEDHALSSINVQQPSENLVRPSPTREEKRKRGMTPRTQPSDTRHLRRLSSNISHITLIDGATEVSRKSEEYDTSQELDQVPSNEADAMGASSVCDESSPLESTQYYGGSSGIAFMRVIRQVLGDKGQEEAVMTNTPSSTDGTNLGGFKQTVRSELLKLLPKFEGPRFRPDLFALPTRTLSDALLENYWNRVHPLCPLLHRPTFEAAYATLWNPAGEEPQFAQESDAGLGNIIDAGPSHQTFYCALNMMLALGTQFLNVSVSERNKITAMFEQRSKSLLAVDMMDRGSIAIVQTLLLNGQYLQSTFCPQRCWNSIGVACRIAQGLGLHVDQSPAQKTLLEQEMRRRVWYACMMLDVSGSVAMGRPLMILHKFSTLPPSPLDDDKPQSMQSLGPAIGSFLEGIKLSDTLGTILTTIYDQNISNSNMSAGNQKHIQTPTEIDTVLELDKKLTKFQNELPIELRWASEGEKLRQSLGPSVGNLDMQSNALHARFLQSRILLFRTTFIQLCQDAVSKPNEESPNASTDSEFDVDTFFVTRGAASCVASARELLKLIHRTSLSPSSDAWWYNVYYAHTAGMVVKLAQLCHPLKQIITASSLEESWEVCRETLSKMNVYGQVPRRCLESLEAMQQKISRLEQLNSKQNFQAPPQSITESNDFGQQTFQEANPSGQIQMSQGQGIAQPQVSEHFIEIDGLLGSGMPLDRTPNRMEHEDRNYPNWSKEFTDLWSFPGGEFGFDDLAFMQQL
ncbi:Fungal specific transcription factor domain containing protein [Hyaloscypha variabilis]